MSSAVHKQKVEFYDFASPAILHYLYELIILKDWRYKDNGTLDRTHLRFFTKKSLFRILFEHGFVVEAFGDIISTTHPLIHVGIVIIQALTLGYSSDIQYLQFGLRARKIWL